MKVKVIAGIRHVEISDSLCGAWIEFVSFPMVVTNYEAECADDPEEITLHNEGEFVAWADAAFEPEGYELWDMEIPTGSTATAANFLRGQLEAIDQEITAASDAGYPTADLTDALDHLQQELACRVAVPAALLEQAANGLEESATRYEEDARELDRFTAEAEFVAGYSTRAEELRAEAETLRTWTTGAVLPTPGPKTKSGH